jgi:DNA-binding response OmpR family regulator
MKKILVVDDNADLRLTVTKGLGTLTSDYEFDEAADGKEALKKMDENVYDLVLLDIMMPEMDGWDVASEMVKNPKTKDTPIIFLTAKTDSLSKGMGKLSAKDYIQKPFDTIDLHKRVEAVLK